MQNNQSRWSTLAGKCTHLYLELNQTNFLFMNFVEKLHLNNSVTPMKKTGVSSSIFTMLSRGSIRNLSSSSSDTIRCSLCWQVGDSEKWLGQLLVLLRVFCLVLLLGRKGIYSLKGIFKMSFVVLWCVQRISFDSFHNFLSTSCLQEISKTSEPAFLSKHDIFSIFRTNRCDSCTPSSYLPTKN